MRKRVWVYNPHVGGVRIPPAVRERTEQRIREYADARYAGTFNRLDIRFRGALCYIDAYTEPEAPSRSLLRTLGETRAQYMEWRRRWPLHLCRLRYFAENRWSVAFYTYSNERYEPCTFDNGTFHGTPEEGFEVGAVYFPKNALSESGGPNLHRHAELHDGTFGEGARKKAL
jgi:hypothetical protein